MLFHRLPSFVFRLPALFFLIAVLLEAGASAQQPVSPMPPPVTRGLYRSRWFEFWNAHLEDDARAAGAALAELTKAARAVGIHRLSDFARTAAHAGWRAETDGRFERAARAYDAALALDDASCDAWFSRVRLSLRQGDPGRAVAALPGALRSLVATGESRLAVFSGLLLWAAAGLAAATLGSILILLVRHQSLSFHLVRELAGRFFGSQSAALPLSLILLLLPLAFGLGPVWVVLYWGALVFASCQRDERVVLAAALTAFGLIPVLTAVISWENTLERSPLYVAAIDLAEKREDASAEDGLRQASGVFGEDPDVWLLLGIFAERSADSERALNAYGRAVKEGPDDYRPLVNRGNIQFEEGNIAGAIRDYEAAAEKTPAAEIYYNLALARGESYDFQGQEEAMGKARRISARQVAYWVDHPTLARVVPASYPIWRARRKTEEWSREPRGRRLPGEVSASRLIESFASRFALGPWAVLVLALLLTPLAARLGLAAECPQCGKPHCRSCSRHGVLPGSCSCSSRRRALKGIDASVRQAQEGRRLTRRRDLSCRLLSLALPGSHRYLSGRPASGFLTLFFFFFLLAAAVINNRLFGPLRLAPARAWTGLTIAALVAATGVWAASLRSAWRQSHGA
jgi:tetratricopeptide (TPR) repeat protein